MPADPVRERGRTVAAALAGAWRPAPPPLALPVAALADIAPLLLGTGAAGLAWWRTRDQPLQDSVWRSRLGEAYRLQAILAALHEHQLLRALALLRSAGTEPLLFKGWAAARLYPAPGLRPYGDLDLCVRPEQHAAARAALASPAGQDCPVDLHAGIRLLQDRSLEEIHRRARAEIVGETEVKVLGPEDHLRLLCLHLLDHGAWRPLWLCDVAAALESLPSDFDWDVFLGGSRRRADWAACALVLTHRLFGVRLDEAPRAVRTRSLPRWLVPAVLRQWGDAHTDRAPLAHHLKTRTGVLESLRRSWPDPITASVGVRAPFNESPRLPFQIAQCAKRSAQIALQLLRSPSA